MKRICKQCGIEFTLSEDEIAFYRNKNLHLPKRCEQCRRENKAKTGEKPAQMTFRPYHEKRSSGIKWWVAAAAVCALLALAVGAFRAGSMSEKVRHDTAVSPEVSENISPAAGIQEDTHPEVSGEADDIPADTGQDVPSVQTADSQIGMSGEADDTPADMVQDNQAEMSGEADDIPADAPQETPEDTQTSRTASPAYQYSFRKTEYLQEHFEKHGEEFGYTSADEYLAGANRVVETPGVLHKLEAEDGDDVYYLESSNEFVIISTDGYLRTYFKPNDGKAYFDRQ